MSKNWLVTGASSGLGRGLVDRALARGDKVVATLRKPGALDDLLASHTSHLRIAECDVTDLGAMRRVVAESFDAFGRIDIIVSNAGYGLFGAAEELSDAQIDRQIATNLTGSMQFIRAVIPRLRDQGGGRIVQVSSEGGQIAYPSFAAYHATKWGIEGFVEAVAQEVAPFGIDFVIVEPGPTRTNFGTGLDRAAALPCYADTPAGELRRALDSGYFEFADAAKTVEAMLVTIDEEKPPLRLALGKFAYEHIRDALTKRLASVEAQKVIALSVMGDS
jgi:NAD(P)-dependent dehydrogenase (short-subunit alcohol dehydrogenase family)